MARSTASNLWVTQHGTGVPLLCMHGGPGWDHHYLRPGLDLLAANAALWYVDLPGNGRSPAAPPHPDGPLIAQVEAIDACREACGLSRIVCYGHSFGALVALAWALRHPDRVAGLVLESPYARFQDVLGTFPRVAARASPEQMELLGTCFTSPPPTDEAMRAVTDAVLPLYFHLPTPERLAAFGRVTCRAAPFREAATAILPATDLTPRLHEIRVPTLVLSGRHDWLTPPDGAADVVAHGIPGARLVAFEASAHFPSLEETTRVAQVIASWLDTLDASPSPRRHTRISPSAPMEAQG